MLPSKSQLKESSDDDDSDFDGNERETLNYTVKKINQVANKYTEQFANLGDEEATFDFGKNFKKATIGTVT